MRNSSGRRATNKRLPGRPNSRLPKIVGLWYGPLGLARTFPICCTAVVQRLAGRARVQPPPRYCQKVWIEGLETAPRASQHLMTRIAVGIRREAGDFAR